MQQFRDAMSRALFLANRASAAGDVPVGAVVLDPLGNVIGEGWNVREAHHDPTGHAEIIALRQAGERLKRWNLVGCTLVVTLEPCTMCAGAAVSARVDRVVFGAWEPKTGAAGSLRDVLRDSRMGHDIEVIPGVLAQEASAQLTSFFEECRRRESLKANVPPPLETRSSDEEIARRRALEALREKADRTPRPWEGEGAGQAQSLVHADDDLVPVEWDEAARAKYGNLPKVPQLSLRPRYGSLSAEALRAREEERRCADREPDEAPAEKPGQEPVVAGALAENLTEEPVVSMPASEPELAPADLPVDERLRGLPPELRAVVAGIAARRRR